jgi:hypothetical protein
MGANISLSWQESGDELTMEENWKAREWLVYSASSFA